MTNAQYDAVVRDLLGETTLSAASNGTADTLLAPDSAGSLTDIGWNGYLTAAADIAADVMAGSNKSKFISCDPTAGTCLSDTIKAFGRKAFRRPLTTTEVTSFMRLGSLTPAGTSEQVGEALLYAFLASPSFIMLPELAQDKSGNNIQLNSYEVATRLSFLLWNSVPDDTLNTAADAGKLTDPAQILSQAQRMLKDSRAAAVVSTYHQYYAGIMTNSHWLNQTTHD
ncbi:MAG TPA: DUF1592 domain-containing protein, partial [Polyangia bacterium]